MTSASSAAELARRLSQNALAVCRHYLRAGHREGRYWLVGDVGGAAGRSLYVRLTGPDFGKGAAGKWTDAESGDYGDLLDLIELNRGLSSIRAAMDEARAFLRLPQPTERPCPFRGRSFPGPRNTVTSAQKLFAMSQPISGMLAEAYLRHRGIDPDVVDVSALRFHPRCHYRDGGGATTRIFPALIAEVTDDAGRISGIHRTWLDPHAIGEKAPVADPRRSLGDLLGFGVRFGGSYRLRPPRRLPAARLDHQAGRRLCGAAR